jgi:hypothetical protein
MLIVATAFVEILAMANRVYACDATEDKREISQMLIALMVPYVSIVITMLLKKAIS